MRLIKKQKIGYCEIICTGSIVSLEDNKALANMLKVIMEGGIKKLQEEQKYERFVDGLIYSFEQDGLISKNKLTKEGEKVVNSQKSWKKQQGIFKLCIVTDGDQNNYIVNCIPQYGDNIRGFEKLERQLKFNGNYENNKGMNIKDIQLDKNIFIGSIKEVELECIYDYITEKNSYKINIDNDKIEFPENSMTFKLVDNINAIDMLRGAIVNYENFIVNGTKITLTKHSGGELFEGVLKQIFETGYFDVQYSDYKIEGLRARIDNLEVAKEVLLKYLLGKAEEKYCGYSEINMLLSKFYGLFENCVDVELKTQNIYSELIGQAYHENETAYLRLCAYDDLKPDNIQKLYRKYTPIDLSNDKQSICDLTSKIIQDNNVKSVSMITKYAYTNASISRAAGLLANSIKRKHNIKLHLITAINNDNYQSDVAKNEFNKLKNNGNIDLDIKNYKEISKIHDRYFRVEYNSGEVDWIKMTCELDAIKYDNDFTDGKTPNPNIDQETKGRVKEMTIIYIDEEGIIPLVKNVMEG